MAVAQTPIYQEVYHFLAASPRRQEILAFCPSEAMQGCLYALFAANKEDRLMSWEQVELDELEQIEHFVRMLKLYTQQLNDLSLTEPRFRSASPCRVLH